MQNQFTPSELAEIIKGASAEFRQELLGLLVKGTNQDFTFSMADWRAAGGVELDDINDAKPYAVKASIGNQTFIEFTDSQGEPHFGLVLEVNNGVPALHMDLNGGDSLLHIHATKEGLVLTADSDRFEQAEANRYSYDDTRSLIVLAQSN